MSLEGMIYIPTCSVNNLITPPFLVGDILKPLNGMERCVVVTSTDTTVYYRYYFITETHDGEFDDRHDNVLNHKSLYTNIFRGE